MDRLPLRHIVRVRKSDDLTFVRSGLMDELLINANHLENSPNSSAMTLQQTGLPFSVDSMLWRFQVPSWWRNEEGQNKKNYTRLGAAYTKGTTIKIASGPLPETVTNDQEWHSLASNVVEYQRNRLDQVPTQLDLFGQDNARELRPIRILAPALISFSKAEDRINRQLAEASVNAAADKPIAVPVIAPLQRLLDMGDIDRMLASVPSEGISAYFVWTPNVPEQLLLNQPDVFAALLRLISALIDRNIPVGHLHANYVIAAVLTSLRDSLRGPSTFALVHHLGWVDTGERPEPGGSLRSCQTYVPGVRHCLHFDEARELGRSLDADDYAARYCECAFCGGSFANGQHPLDLMLEDQLIVLKNEQERLTPTGRAVTANAWHYLLSRRLEIQAFSEQSAVAVLQQDMQRAADLAGGGEVERLRRLADNLPAA